jgi:hypothetical protein
MFFKRRNTILYFLKNLNRIIGIVLIWRGIWYLLDYIDKVFFNSRHALSALVGVILGLVLLYLPNKDLKELEKL